MKPKNKGRYKQGIIWHTHRTDCSTLRMEEMRSLYSELLEAVVGNQPNSFVMEVLDDYENQKLIVQTYLQ